jgi:hypothetical protein
MAQIICIRLDWNHTAIPLRIASKYYTLHVDPEPAHPFGRKGLAIAGAWHQLAGPDIAGMLILDGDVAIDPHDHQHMLQAIDKDPHNTIHTAPVILWPTSTHTDSWVWGHGTGGHFTQDDTDDNLDTFTFCYTYLPRRLMEACLTSGLTEWTYPGVDGKFCHQARTIGTPVNVVRSASPKHLNY